MKAPRKLKKKAKRSLERAYKCKVTIIKLIAVENGIRRWDYKQKITNKNK
jgi:hypothetical protein